MSVILKIPVKDNSFDNYLYRSSRACTKPHWSIERNGKNIKKRRIFNTTILDLIFTKIHYFMEALLHFYEKLLNELLTQVSIVPNGGFYSYFQESLRLISLSENSNPNDVPYTFITINSI